MNKSQRQEQIKFLKDEEKKLKNSKKQEAKIKSLQKYLNIRKY